MTELSDEALVPAEDWVVRWPRNADGTITIWTADEIITLEVKP